MKFFTRLFGRKSEPRDQNVVIHLALRSQPAQRGEYFEDPLEEMLDAEGLGWVVGGETELAEEPAGVRSCEIELSVRDTTPHTIQKIIAMLELLGAPKGSEIHIPGKAPVPFGITEGLGLFLNGTDLPSEVYESADINETINGLSNAMSGTGVLRGYWEGNRETALYFYGARFDEMKKAALAYSARDPLCAQCRLEQIA